MTTTLKYYASILCPYVHRTWIAMEESNVPREHIEIDLHKQETRSEWYTNINPHQKVPAFVLEDDNNKLVVESLVLLEYIAEVYNPNLLPQDAFGKSQVRRWIAFCDDNITSYLFKVMMAKKSNNEEQLHQHVSQLQSNMKLLAKHTHLVKRVQETNGKTYLYSNEFTTLDCALLPFLYRMHLMFNKVFGVTLFDESVEELRAWKSYLEYAIQRPSFQRSGQKFYETTPFEKVYGNNSAMKEYAMNSIDTFDFDHLIVDSVVKKYMK